MADESKLEARIADLEDYNPVLNERIADNELAIQKMDERLTEELSKPSADLTEVNQKLDALALQVTNTQNQQLSVARVKNIVDDSQTEVGEQIQRLQKKVIGIGEMSERAFGLKAEIEGKSAELDKVVNQKLAKAHEQMLRQAENIDDSCRDRIQNAKDDIWDEFSDQLKEMRAMVQSLQEDSARKEAQI